MKTIEQIYKELSFDTYLVSNETIIEMNSRDTVLVHAKDMVSGATLTRVLATVELDRIVSISSLFRNNHLTILIL